MFFDVAEQFVDVFLKLWIFITTKFELENIGDLLSLDYDEVRSCDFAIKRIPCWFDNDMTIS